MDLCRFQSASRVASGKVAKLDPNVAAGSASKVFPADLLEFLWEVWFDTMGSESLRILQSTSAVDGSILSPSSLRIANQFFNSHFRGHRGHRFIDPSWPCRIWHTCCPYGPYAPYGFAVIGGLLERVSRLSPLSNRWLPRQHEASHTGEPASSWELGCNVLSAAVVWVCRLG